MYKIPYKRTWTSLIWLKFKKKLFITNFWNGQAYLNSLVESHLANNLTLVNFTAFFQSRTSVKIIRLVSHSRYYPRFFDQVGHENMSAFIEDKHFFTKSCHRQTYKNYKQPPQTYQNSYFQSHFSVFGRIIPKNSFYEEYLTRRPTFNKFSFFGKFWFLRYFIS